MFPIFQRVSNVQSGDTVILQQSIDNAHDNKYVGLKSISCTIGWYNINAPSIVEYIHNGNTYLYTIDPGLYSLNELINLFNQLNSGLTCNVPLGKDGIIALRIASGYTLHIQPDIVNVFGLDPTSFTLHVGGTFLGVKIANSAIYSSLHVRLDQLNSTNNINDGAPSSVLAEIPISSGSLGDVNTIFIEKPLFKRLNSGLINELKVAIFDEYGTQINNHGLQISIVLEIRKNEHIRCPGCQC